VAAPTVRDESETGTIVMVAKVGFLLATDAECKKAAIRAEHGLNGKHVLPTAMIRTATSISVPAARRPRAMGHERRRAGAHRGESVSAKGRVRASQWTRMRSIQIAERAAALSGERTGRREVLEERVAHRERVRDTSDADQAYQHDIWRHGTASLQRLQVGVR
jgi:hypothetical protein